MTATSTFMLVFRLLHILAALFWAGSVALFVLFITPAAREVGPAAGPVLANLVLKRRAIRVVVGSAATTVLAGAVLYWKDVQLYGSLGDFLDTAFGLWMTIGAAAALVAFAIGVSVVAPGVERAVRLGGEIARAEGAAPPELGERLRALQARNWRASRTALALVTVAAFSMATARYW